MFTLFCAAAFTFNGRLFFFVTRLSTKNLCRKLDDLMLHATMNIGPTNNVSPLASVCYILAG